MRISDWSSDVCFPISFIIDPIDGTKNFTAGLPLFGVMAAATVRGEVVLGAIHDPVCGDTALALRGEGAWQIGRESCRERVCQYVSISVVAVSLKKKK